MDLLTPGGIGGGGNYNAAGHAVTSDPTEVDLLTALEAMERGDIEYVILEDAHSQLFMQAAGDAKSGYVLEYAGGQADTIYSARGTVTGPLLTEILAAFLNHDQAWRTRVVWDIRG